ncbi:MAG: hypothetical protein AAF840_16980, partial [Bacteroidota bacterium]
RMLDGNNAQQRAGILQSALDVSKINEELELYGNFSANAHGGLSENADFTGDAEAVRIPVAATAPSFVNQGDILQAAGAAMRPRSDTFTICCYGDASSGSGTEAQVWCEAVVQRTTTPCFPDMTNPLEVDSSRPGFGRKYKIVSFRWLSRDEI